MCKCDSFAHLQSSLSFQTSHLVGRAFPVCCVAPCVAVSVSPWCVRSSREALTAPSSRLGMLRELDGGRGAERWEKEEEGGGGVLLSPAGFILTSFPRAPHTSWISLNYAPSMVQRSKWCPKKYCVMGCELLGSYFTIHHQRSFWLRKNSCNEYM